MRNAIILIHVLVYELTLSSETLRDDGAAVALTLTVHSRRAASVCVHDAKREERKNKWVAQREAGGYVGNGPPNVKQGKATKKEKRKERERNASCVSCG